MVILFMRLQSGLLFMLQTMEDSMQYLKDRINELGEVRSPEILKVDRFLNHQLDVELLNAIGKEFNQRFQGEKVTKILTIEASGIAIAAIAAQYFKCPVVFAKKVPSQNLDASTFETDVFSYTKKTTYKVRVARKFLHPEDHVLILDDFLAQGQAAIGLMNLVKQAGATLTGVGIVIEKGFQEGGTLLRTEGVRLESLAIIESMTEGNVVFRERQQHSEI